MKRYVVTIDTGTTNTRSLLWDENGQVIGTEKASVGVRDTAKDGNNKRLSEAVKGCLEALLENNGIGYDDVESIVASGMITSNVGLVEIPHCVAPVGKKELADAIKPVLLENVCPLPIWFIPGVKNSDGKITLENFEAMDIMRGEEVECVSLIEEFGLGKKYLLILPGSHIKFVSINEAGKIEGCLTTLSGELLSAIINETIIADAVGRSYVTDEIYDKDMILQGYHTAKKFGTSRSCFSARILNQFVIKDKKKVANYIYGVVIQNDIFAALNTSAITVDSNTTVIIGGNSAYCRALYDILESEHIFKEVINRTSADGIPFSAKGAYAIAKEKHLS